jgi:hypothetical protein
VGWWLEGRKETISLPAFMSGVAESGMIEILSFPPSQQTYSQRNSVKLDAIESSVKDVSIETSIRKNGGEMRVLGRELRGGKFSSGLRLFRTDRTYLPGRRSRQIWGRLKGLERLFFFFLVIRRPTMTTECGWD